MKTTLIALVSTAVSLGAPAIVKAKEARPAAGKPAPSKKSGHVAANGVSYYYEIHGKGEPLLLLHGGLGSIDMFGPVLPILAEGRQVIAVDLHGHAARST